MSKHHYFRILRERLFKLLMVTSYLLFSGGVNGAEQVLPFSGIAFTSEKSVARDSLPYSFKSIGDLEVSPNEFVQSLNAAAHGIQLNNGSVLSSTKINSVNSGQGLVMALALENESMKISPLSASQYQLTFNLDAQILIFNFREKAIVAAYPLRMTLLNVLQRKPEEKDLEDLAKVMFFGDPERNFFEDVTEPYLLENFIATVKKITIKPVWGAQIRIMDIDFSEQAHKVLNEHQIDPDYFRQLAASTLSSSMSTRINLPILPYIKSDAIENSMTLRFSDTDLMNLKVPEADFHINLFVRGFGQKELRSTGRTKIISFISGIKLSVIDNTFGKIYMETKFQSGNVRKLSNAMSVDEWGEYEISFLSLLDQISGQLDRPEKKWIKEHTSKNKSPKTILKEFKKIKTNVIDQIKG